VDLQAALPGAPGGQRPRAQPVGAPLAYPRRSPPRATLPLSEPFPSSCHLAAERAAPLLVPTLPLSEPLPSSCHLAAERAAPSSCHLAAERAAPVLL